MSWVKLDEHISEDIAFADLLTTNPLAAALFTMSLPRADLYGVLPGDPRAYRVRVCPAAELTAIQIADVIEALRSAGMYHVYQVDGIPYIYVRRYHRYQDIRWARVGPPQNPLPECWECPQELRDSPHHDRLLRRSVPDTPDESRSIPEYPGVSRLDVDVDVDVDTDVDTDVENDLLSEPVANAPVPDAPKAPRRRLMQSPEQIAAGIAGAYAALPTDDRSLIERYLDAAASENSTRAITAGRQLTLLQELVPVAADLGPERFRYGMERALAGNHGNGVANARYVRKAGASWTGLDQPRRYQPAKPTHRQPGLIET